MSTEQNTDSRQHSVAQALVRLEKAAQTATEALKTERARAEAAEARLATLSETEHKLKAAEARVAELERAQAGLGGLLDEVEARIDDAVSSIQGVLDGATEAEGGADADGDAEADPDAESEPEEFMMADADQSEADEPANDAGEREESEPQNLSLLS